MPVSLDRNDENYTYRYTANAWFKDAKFSDDGSELEIYALNGYLLPVTGSFEFPTNSIHEKYEVVLDGERLAEGASAKDPKLRFTETVESLQSIDEMGNWHLYFEIPESFQGDVRISGFVDNDGTFTVPEEMDITNLLYYEVVGGEINTITAMPKKASLVVDIETIDDGYLSLKINDFLVRPFENDEYIVQIHSEPRKVDYNRLNTNLCQRRRLVINLLGEIPRTKLCQDLPFWGFWAPVPVTLKYLGWRWHTEG